MKIFKFGGASVKDATSINNVVDVLQKVGHQEVLLVVSAMGKTTNALEIVVQNYFKKTPQLNESIQDVKKYHLEIVLELFEDENAPHFKELHQKITTLFAELNLFLEHSKSKNYNFVYDQIVGYGELLSSTILSAFLTHKSIKNNWLDAREYIKTDTNYRDATIDWDTTQKLIAPLSNTKKLFVTQGFIGSDANNFSTTLGREGSDYSAAIFAYCMNATSVTIWKDVPGVMNGDPRFFENAILLHQISYREAIELAFYGASVIHPKTLQPLQRKEIPLFVKSFVNPLLAGTSVSKGADLVPETPCFIVKQNQLLLSLSSLDFSFILEENLSEIFALFHQYKIKVNLMQNTAISFTVCIEDKFNEFENLKQILAKKFKVTFTENVSLFTVRHFTDAAIATLEKNKTILLKQISKENLQIVTEE